MIKKLFFLLIIIFSVTSVVCAEGLTPKIKKTRLVEKGKEYQNVLHHGLDGALTIYKNYVSGVIGSRCKMVPTCSSYSRDALNKHGVIIGFVLTFDRLMREGDEYRYSSVIYNSDKKLVTYDPVEGNTFWWEKRGHL